MPARDEEFAERQGFLVKMRATPQPPKLTTSNSTRYTPLGRTGHFVSQLCLGIMTVGGSRGIWSKTGTLQ
jgi:hypothetical protein